MAVLATTRMPPAMTITALTTERTMTSRTLRGGAVSERTAQRSHRGMPPASHTGRSAQHDLSCDGHPGAFARAASVPRGGSAIR